MIDDKLFCLLTGLSTSEHANPEFCKTTKQGPEYSGKVSVTAFGKTCQSWDSQSPHSHTQDEQVGNFPEKSLENAHNYCRNPNGKPNGPWCYTTDPASRWEYCKVPVCK